MLFVYLFVQKKRAHTALLSIYSLLLHMSYGSLLAGRSEHYFGMNCRICQSLNFDTSPL